MSVEDLTTADTEGESQSVSSQPTVASPDIQPSSSELEDVINDLSKGGSQPNNDADGHGQRASSRDQLAPLLEVPVTLEVRFCSLSMSVSQLMDLHEGAEIDLCRTVGESVELCVNGCVIARGVLFLQDEADKRVGVRITSLGDQLAKSEADQ